MRKETQPKQKEVLTFERPGNPLLKFRNERPKPTILERADGECLLYDGRLNVVYGEPESGKSWLAMVACLQETEKGNTVWFLDFEADADTFVFRLRDMGAEDPQIEEVRYNGGEEMLAQFSRDLWDEKLGPWLDEDEPTLVVIDGYTNALTQSGLSVLDSGDAALFHQVFTQKVLDKGIGVLMIAHVAKNASKPNYAFGAQHFKAITKGSMLRVEADERRRPGIGKAGRSFVVA